MPPKYEAIARLVRDVGVPSIIALFLIWFLSGQVLTAIDTHSAETDVWMRQLINISRQICVNTAPDAESRAGCLAPLP